MGRGEGAVQHEPYWSDGYRQDCSGFVSMAWGLPGNEWTGSLDQYAVRITKERTAARRHSAVPQSREPREGLARRHFRRLDGLHAHLLHRLRADPPARPPAGHPVCLLEPLGPLSALPVQGVDGRHAGRAAEHVPPIRNGGDAPYPGAAYFGPGANNKYVTQLGQLLVERGARRFYTSGPGPRWSDADRRATQAFQQAQGWTGAGRGRAAGAADLGAAGHRQGQGLRPRRAAGPPAARLARGARLSRAGRCSGPVRTTSTSPSWAGSW